MTDYEYHEFTYTPDSTAVAEPNIIEGIVVYEDCALAHSWIDKLKFIMMPTELLEFYGKSIYCNITTSMGIPSTKETENKDERSNGTRTGTCNSEECK